MSGQTEGDSAGGTALVFEQRIQDLCHDELFEHGTGTEVAYDLISNELLLDGSARLNLATFVTTWMPPPAAALMAKTAHKNMIDKDEYPQTAEIERRCVNIIGRLWHAPGNGDVTGCSTTGSSEAAMLGGLALKWRWRERMKAAGKPTDRPNLVTASTSRCAGRSSVATGMSSHAWSRWKGTGFTSVPRKPPPCATRTRFGVVAVLGSTFDGSYEPISEICAALDHLAADGGPTSRSTSTEPRAGSSPRSFSPTSHGTSACPGSSRSTRSGTSTAWCIPVSGGRSGATRRRSRVTWCSMSTTWAGACRRSL